MKPWFALLCFVLQFISSFVDSAYIFGFKTSAAEWSRSPYPGAPTENYCISSYDHTITLYWDSTMYQCAVIPSSSSTLYTCDTSVDDIECDASDRPLDYGVQLDNTNSDYSCIAQLYISTGTKTYIIDIDDNIGSSTEHKLYHIISTGSLSSSEKVSSEPECVPKVRTPSPTPFPTLSTSSPTPHPTQSTSFPTAPSASPTFNPLSPTTPSTKMDYIFGFKTSSEEVTQSHAHIPGEMWQYERCGSQHSHRIILFWDTKRYQCFVTPAAANTLYTCNTQDDDLRCYIAATGYGHYGEYALQIKNTFDGTSDAYDDPDESCIAEIYIQQINSVTKEITKTISIDRAGDDDQYLRYIFDPDSGVIEDFKTNSWNPSCTDPEIQYKFGFTTGADTDCGSLDKHLMTFYSHSSVYRCVIIPSAADTTYLCASKNHQIDCGDNIPTTYGLQIDSIGFDDSCIQQICIEEISNVDANSLIYPINDEYIGQKSSNAVPHRLYDLTSSSVQGEETNGFTDICDQILDTGFTFGIKTGSSLFDYSDINSVKITLFWSDKAYQCVIQPVSSETEYFCDTTTGFYACESSAIYQRYAVQIEHGANINTQYIDDVIIKQFDRTTETIERSVTISWSQEYSSNVLIEFDPISTNIGSVINDVSGSICLRSTDEFEFGIKASASCTSNSESAIVTLYWEDAMYQCDIRECAPASLCTCRSTDYERGTRIQCDGSNAPTNINYGIQIDSTSPQYSGIESCISELYIGEINGFTNIIQNTISLNVDAFTESVLYHIDPIGNTQSLQEIDTNVTEALCTGQADEFIFGFKSATIDTNAPVGDGPDSDLKFCFQNDRYILTLYWDYRMFQCYVDGPDDGSHSYYDTWYTCNSEDTDIHCDSSRLNRKYSGNTLSDNHRLKLRIDSLSADDQTSCISEIVVKEIDSSTKQIVNVIPIKFGRIHVQHAYFELDPSGINTESNVVHLNDNTDIPVCNQHFVELTTCDGWEYDSGNKSVMLQFKGSNGTSQIFYLNPDSGLPTLGKTQSYGIELIKIEKEVGELYSVSIFVEDSYGYCIRDLKIKTLYDTAYDFGSEYFGDGIIISSSCDYSFFYLSSAYMSSELPLIRCISTPLQLNTYSKRGIYDLKLHSCIMERALMTISNMVDNLYVVLMGTSHGINAYEASSFLYLDHSGPSSSWNQDEFRTFQINIDIEFDDITLIEIVNNDKGDRLCIDEIWINGTQCIYISNNEIGGPTATSSLTGILKYPVCGTEVINTRVDIEGSTSKALDDASKISGLHCSNYNKLVSSTCSISQSYELSATRSIWLSTERSRTKEYSWGEASTVTTSTTKTTSATFSWGFSEEIGVEIKPVKVGVTANQQWTKTSESSKTKENSETENWQKTRSSGFSRDTGNSWESTRTITIECSAEIEVPPSHSIKYTLIFSSMNTTLKTYNDLKLTLCSAFLNPSEPDEAHYKYIDNIPGLFQHQETTACNVEFQPAEYLRSDIRCDEEQKLAISSGSNYIPRCRSSDSAVYDGCQCDTGDSLTSAVCWCSDSTGNPLDGKTAQVSDDSSFQQVCVQDLQCTDTEITYHGAVRADTAAACDTDTNECDTHSDHVDDQNPFNTKHVMWAIYTFLGLLTVYIMVYIYNSCRSRPSKPNTSEMGYRVHEQSITIEERENQQI